MWELKMWKNFMLKDLKREIVDMEETGDSSMNYRDP